MQVLFDSASTVAEYCPGGQNAHDDEFAALYDPAEHSKHVVAPYGANRPAAHPTHVSPCGTVPGRHAAHPVLPARTVKVPLEQIVQLGDPGAAE